MREELESHLMCLDDGSYYAHYHDLILVSAFQPIFTPDGNVFAYEALLRIFNSSQQLIDTGNIIHAYQLEQTHLINLDRLARVIHLRNFAHSFSTSNLFINMAPVAIIDGNRQQLTESIFLPRLFELGLSPERIYIEILEHYCENDKDLVHAINSYHRRGFKIAIDDYGVAGSAEQRTRALNPNLIKMDKSLLQDYLNGNPMPMQDAIALAREIGSKVLIEGIEDKACYLAAITLGADFFQGYYMGRPKMVSSIFTTPHHQKPITSGKTLLPEQGADHKYFLNPGFWSLDPEF
ncbi:EAL domain-containing protein [Photobacterium nomapromontoriensis]|uniref:EAL domain-containing protein n=1 Tax=Photobacterium nomapromontoriensis TaxID=2910237 RepID=UPI003D1070D3